MGSSYKRLAHEQAFDYPTYSNTRAAIEYIGQMKNTQDNLVRSQDVLTREVEALRNESQSYMAMRAELEGLRMELQAAQGYHHPQQNSYHPQSHHQSHNSVNGGGPGRMQGIERC